MQGITGCSSRRRCRVRAWYTPALLAIVVCTLALGQEDGKRVALVIGNDTYATSPLRNAVNDARAMDKALRAAGYKTKLLENASKEQMDDAIGAFADTLGPDHHALFYYSGHAFQIENENFLVPVDFKAPRGMTQAKVRCVSLATLLEELKRARARTRIIILDSCRSNPMAQSYSLSAGLSQTLNAGGETYIAYSAGPNQVATDNPESKNSWFTEALAGLVAQNLDIDEIFNKVRKRVQIETEGKQTPWTQSSLTNRFYFRPRQGAAEDNDPTTAQVLLEDAARREQREEWAEAADALNRALARKPGSTVEIMAKNRLPYIAARRAAQTNFLAGDYTKAAELYVQAFHLDPFASDAAMQAAGSYLLNDQMDAAVGMLKAVRVRGSSEAIAKADAMLKELATASAAAGRELQSAVPAPPPASEVFSGVRFGIPDYDAGKRYLQASAVEITRWVTELQDAAPPPVLSAPAAPPPPAATATAVSSSPVQPPAEAPVHFDVVAIGATRELDYAPSVESPAPSPRRTGSSKPVKPATGAAPGPAQNPAPTPAQNPAQNPAQTPQSTAAPPEVEEFGFVQFDGPVDNTPVLVNGKPVEQLGPGKLKLPPGSYEIRAMRGVDIIDRQSVEVKPSSVTRIAVKR